MEEECLLIHMGQVVLRIIIALYIAILLSMMEEECILTYMKELVELSIVTALYTIIMLKMMEEECILICMKEKVELTFVTVKYSKILHNSDQDCIFVLFMLLRHQVASAFRMFYFISIKQPITWLYTEKYINLL